MSHSKHKVELVLIYNPAQHAAYWLTMSQATRCMAVNPQLEIVNPVDSDYSVKHKMAGEMPAFYVEAPATIKGPDEHEE